MNPMNEVVIAKATVNIGVGEAGDKLSRALNLIESMFGQKPVRTFSKVTNPEFGIRKKQPIACKVTLRGEKMWNFVENLVNIALPRVRDFKGLPANSFDNQGNYTMGIKEQIIFTEINFDEIKRVRGFNITFVTSTNKKEETMALLRAIGLPIVKR